MAFNQKRIEKLTRELLIAIGEDPDREGLIDTPRRYAAWWQEFIEYDPGKIETVFTTASTNQMVVVSGIRIWSLCEHHLLPFWCDVSIGYIPDEKLIGLSKLGRIAHMVAHRLQVQERITAKIADSVEHYTGTKSVAVAATGEHLCMSSRGIKSEARMSSTDMRGAFRVNDSIKNEFFQLVRGLNTD